MKDVLYRCDKCGNEKVAPTLNGKVVVAFCPECRESTLHRKVWR